MAKCIGEINLIIVLLRRFKKANVLNDINLDHKFNPHDILIVIWLIVLLIYKWIGEDIINRL